MELFTLRTRSSHAAIRGAIAVACAALLAFGDAAALAQQTPPAGAPAAKGTESAKPDQDEKLSPDQLDSLVAPIALYPDDLLAQVLAASTYPLELVQLQQWMAKHKDLKDKALADAVAKQPWDPAIQSMAALPEVVKRLADDIQWTTDLGNAFLDQQADVMDACQRMRKKAQDKGALKTNEQQVVETKVVETKEVIVVQSANPEVVYVPSYNPTVVYPPPVYPYPPVYYPPYYPGTALISFGIGMAWGAAIWGGSCCGCGWGGGNNNININRNNNFNRNTSVNPQRGGGGGNNWQHNSQHRGGTPYGNKATANKYGGSARGDSLSSRQQASARQQGAGGRGGAGVSDRSAGGAGGRGGGSQAALGGGSLGSGSGSRGGAGASDRSAGGGFGGGGGGADRVGSRDVGSSGGSRGGGSGFSGGSGGYSGGSARASSSRGSSSMGSRGGGGGGRGGGGGGRGGGGRR